MQSSFTSVPVVFVTQQHVLKGTITFGPLRLLDILNDVRTDFLKLTDVLVFRTHGGEPVASLPSAVVRKSNVVVAMHMGDKHETPQKRYDSYAQKQRYSTYFIAQRCEVRGELALRSAADPVTALSSELEGFFPVPNGTVVFGEGEDQRRTSQVVIVNRNFVSLFQLEELVVESSSSATSYEALQGAAG